MLWEAWTSMWHYCNICHTMQIGCVLFCVFTWPTLLRFLRQLLQYLFLSTLNAHLPYYLWFLQQHWGNTMVTPVLVKQSWMIWAKSAGAQLKQAQQSTDYVHYLGVYYTSCIYTCEHNTHYNTMGPRQNGRHLPDDIFRCIFWMKMYKLRFHWCLFPSVQLTIFHHWFR